MPSRYPVSGFGWAPGISRRRAIAFSGYKPFRWIVRYPGMHKAIRLLAPLPLLIAAAPTPPLQPGLWEHTIVYVVDKVNGSSLVADQAQSVLPSPPPYRACYSASDLANPRDFLLSSKSEQCRFSRFEMANGKLVAAGDCADSRYPTVHVDGSGTYRSAGYDFSFAGHAQSGEVTVEFRGRDSGRRVGSCSAASAS